MKLICTQGTTAISHWMQLSHLLCEYTFTQYLYATLLPPHWSCRMYILQWIIVCLYPIYFHSVFIRNTISTLKLIHFQVDAVGCFPVNHCVPRARWMNSSIAWIVKNIFAFSQRYYKVFFVGTPATCILKVIGISNMHLANQKIKCILYHSNHRISSKLLCSISMAHTTRKRWFYPRRQSMSPSLKVSVSRGSWITPAIPTRPCTIYCTGQWLSKERLGGKCCLAWNNTLETLCAIGFKDFCISFCLRLYITKGYKRCCE